MAPSSGIADWATTSVAASSRLDPLLHLDQHPVDDDDGVVDQHAEGDDQGAERDALERNAHRLQEDEAAADREQQDEADQEPAAQAHEEEQHDDDDGHGLEQAADEARRWPW